MSDAEQREEAIFEAALDLPADRRAGFLEEECAGDAELRRRVEALLGAFARAGGFMKEPAAPEVTRTVVLQPTEKPGDRIGRYKLLEQIGEGGCGVVYVAEQTEPVRRRVALKVIKLGMDTKEVIARFEAERQALALIVIFDLHAGKEQKRWRCQHAPTALAFSPDGRQLTADSIKSEVISIFDAANGQLLCEFPAGASGDDRAMTWHPSGKYLAVSTIEKILFWDVKDTAKMSTLDGHAQQVASLSFDPAGNWLISDSYDGTPRLWQPSPGREWIRFYSGLNQLRFSRDGRWAGVVYPGDGKAQLVEFIPSRVYHTFVRSLGDLQHAFGFADISVDGRLLALASARGVSIRELPSGRELAVLPVGWAIMVRFHPNGKELLISSSQPALGIWPIDRDASAANRIRLGPPRNLPLPLVPYEFALARDGRTLAMSVVSTREAQVMDLDTGIMRDSRFPHPNLDSIALSPDAQWLATAGFFSPQAQVWNAHTGEPALNVTGEPARVSFTPDGRELVVTTSPAYTFYSIKTQKITRHFQRQVSKHLGWIAFTSDGNLMAMEISPGLIRLCEVATGRTIAHLQDPIGDTCNWMGFTPDGTQLIVVANHPRAIHRWDLRTLRRELKLMGLDWAWPEFPPSEAPNPPALEVEVSAR